MKITAPTFLLAILITFAIAGYAVSSLVPVCGPSGVCEFFLNQVLFLPAYVLNPSTPYIITATNGAMSASTIRDLLVVSFLYWFCYALIVSALLSLLIRKRT